MAGCGAVGRLERRNAVRDFGPASDRIIPIPIRQDVTVSIFGIPHDLTPDEAAKIVRVITALGDNRPGEDI